MTFEEISKAHNIAMRTTFRRLENAEAEFAKNLSSLGYDESALQKDFANDKYISSIYMRLQTDKYFVAKNM